MTEEMTIEQQNEMIARFMEWDFKENYSAEGDLSIHAFYQGRQQWIDDKKFLKKFFLNGLNYHQSWERTMPVVEKISKLHNSSYGFTIDPQSIEIRDYSKAIEKVIVNILNDDNYPLIEMYYMAVCDFIKWYNAYIEKQPTTLNQGV